MRILDTLAENYFTYNFFKLELAYSLDSRRVDMKRRINRYARSCFIILTGTIFFHISPVLEITFVELESNFELLRTSYVRS